MKTKKRVFRHALQALNGETVTVFNGSKGNEMLAVGRLSLVKDVWAVDGGETFWVIFSVSAIAEISVTRGQVRIEIG